LSTLAILFSTAAGNAADLPAREVLQVHFAGTVLVSRKRAWCDYWNETGLRICAVLKREAEKEGVGRQGTA